MTGTEVLALAIWYALIALGLPDIIGTGRRGHPRHERVLRRAWGLECND